MGLFRRVFRSLSSLTTTQTSSIQLSTSTDGIGVSQDASGAGACGASASTVDSAFVSQQQSDCGEDHSSDRQAVDLVNREDEFSPGQVDAGDRLDEPKTSDFDEIGQMDTFPAESEDQNDYDLPVDDVTSGHFDDESCLKESDLGNNDGDYRQDDADPFYLQDRPEPAFDDMCQLPPAHQEAAFWDQTTEEAADQDVDSGNEKFDCQ